MDFYGRWRRVEAMVNDNHIHPQNGEHVSPMDIHEYIDLRLHPTFLLVSESCTELCLNKISYLNLNKQPDH